MSIPQPHRLPVVVRALVALGQRMKTANDVDIVLFGPTPKGATKGARTLALFVGNPGATVSLDTASWDQQTYVETVEVTCNAISWSGGTDVSPHMDACGAMWDSLRALVEGDPKLGGVCELATMGRREVWTPVSDSEGASVALAFTVRVQSYV
jgi:hypothetical protein